MILASNRCAQHLFSGRNTQQMDKQTNEQTDRIDLCYLGCTCAESASIQQKTWMKE